MKKGARRYNSILIGIILVFSCLIIIQSVSAEDNINTLVTVYNTPPYQTNTIPNQTIPINQNYTAAFDLDNYFSDNEDILDFNVTQIDNITIFINESTHLVSFYPDVNFTGITNVTFYASDGVFNISSNLVFIIITNDQEPPLWFNPATSQTQIYQNDFVDFSALWTDNVQLAYYIFSIYQNNGWTVYPSIDLRGTTNTSTQRVQISAPPGTNVSWKFLVSDWQGNYNETLLQSFTVQGQIPPSTPSTSREPSSKSDKGALQAAQRARQTVPKGFSVTPDTIVVKLKQGESSNKLLKIDNLGGKEGYFSYELVGLEEFTYIDHVNSTIGSGKSDILSLEFFANRRARPDVYYGKVIVKSGADKKEVPIILTINPFEVEISIALNVLDKYKKIKPGNIVKANITIENLKDLENNFVTLYTSINDFSGNVLDSKQESFNLTERRINLEREFLVDSDLPPGDYVFFARLIKEKSTSIDLDTFQVGENFNFFAFLRTNYLLLLIILVTLITIYLAIYYHRIKEKERLLNLYIMINELKSLLEQNRFTEAVQQYVRIRLTYGEKVNYSTLQNKDEMKAEMENLINSFNKNMPKEIAEKVAPQTPVKNADENKNEEDDKNKVEDKTSKEEKKDEKISKKKEKVGKKKKNVKKK